MVDSLGMLLLRLQRHGYSRLGQWECITDYTNKENLIVKVLDFVKSGGPPGTRTLNLLIKSQLLCQIELAARQRGDFTRRKDTGARLDPASPPVLQSSSFGAPDTST